MIGLNIPSGGSAPPAAAPNPPKFSRRLTQAFAIGGSFFGGGGVIYAMVELVRANPDKGFALLEKWGPWYFLATFALYVGYVIAMKVLDVLSKIGERFAGSMDRIADEQVKLAAAGRDQADAMQRSADRDDRDHERMATLVDYAGQQSRQAAEQVAGLGQLMVKMSGQLDELSKKRDG